MNRDQIIQELKDIVSPYTEERLAFDQLGEHTDFITDLKINSANLVDIVLDIEEKFNITIDNDSMTKMLTVSATLKIIEDKLAGNVG